jgi:hypothetical protein
MRKSGSDQGSSSLASTHQISTSRVTAVSPVERLAAAATSHRHPPSHSARNDAPRASLRQLSATPSLRRWCPAGGPGCRRFEGAPSLRLWRPAGAPGCRKLGRGQGQGRRRGGGWVPSAGATWRFRRLLRRFGAPVVLLGPAMPPTSVLGEVRGTSGCPATRAPDLPERSRRPAWSSPTTAHRRRRALDLDLRHAAHSGRYGTSERAPRTWGGCVVRRPNPRSTCPRVSRALGDRLRQVR